MNATIERLKEQKQETEEKYFNLGKKEGLIWADSAHYESLRYAAEDFEPSESWSQDEEIGDELEEYAGEVAEAYQVAYLKGWKESITEFWSKVSTQLAA